MSKLTGINLTHRYREGWDEINRGGILKFCRVHRLKCLYTEIKGVGNMVDINNPDFMSADTIKGYKVVNTNGDNLGRIENLMIDLDNGRVAYAALSLGEFLGISDKLFAVPWQALSFISDEQAFILAVPRNILEKAEGFDKDKCPTTREVLRINANSVVFN